MNNKIVSITIIGLVLSATSIVVSITIPEVRTFLGLNSITSKEIPGKFPFASQTYLTAENLSQYNSWELRIMRNEIYARRGYAFHKKTEMIDYFKNQSWYAGIPKVSFDSEFIYENLFSDIERSNIEVIRDVENTH